MKAAMPMIALLSLAATGAVRADTAGSRFVDGQAPHETGEAIYRDVCQGCHMADGKGAQGAGRYPALAGDAALASREFVVLTLLGGRRNMPAFAAEKLQDEFFVHMRLGNEQVAAVGNYIRTAFGNRHKGTISAADVQSMREAIK